MLECLVLVYSLANTGDISHANALIEQLQDKSKPILINTIDANLPSTELKAQYEKCKQNHLCITSPNSMILAIGEKGLTALNTLKQAHQLDGLQAKVGVSIHQYFTSIEGLKTNLDFIAIPEATLDTEAKKTVIKNVPHFVLTLAVPTHNPSILQLKTAYDNWDIPPNEENTSFSTEWGNSASQNKPSLSHPYIIVTLPGDAANAQGKINCFHCESALELFKNVVAFRESHQNRHTIIVQNSPRTGKHICYNAGYKKNIGDVICTHEYQKGSDPNLAIDDISRFFINLLKTTNIPYHFFNFAIEKDGVNTKKYSVYDPLLYIALCNTDNYFIVPEESISMLAQIPLYIKPHQAIVFESSSTNPSHRAVFSIIKDRGYLSYFEPLDSKAIPPGTVKSASVKNPPRLQEDATLIANEIKKLFQANYSAVNIQTLTTLNPLARLLRYPEVGGLAILFEAHRRNYIPSQYAMALSAPLICSLICRNTPSPNGMPTPTSPAAKQLFK